MTSDSPAMTVYNGKLYLMYRGGVYASQLERVWYSTFDEKTGQWSSEDSIPNVLISGSPALTVFNGMLYVVHRGAASTNSASTIWCTTFDGTKWSSDQCWNGSVSASPALTLKSGDLLCVCEPFYWFFLDYGKIECDVPLLDVWGEGRCNDDGQISGFDGWQNLNIRRLVSNGENAGQQIPNLVPVESWGDKPPPLVFPIADGVVNYITIMGAPIIEVTAQEMYRVLNKSTGVVLLYGMDQNSINIFENVVRNTRLVLKPDDPIRYPFNQIKGPYFPVRIYGFKGVKDRDEL